MMRFDKVVMFFLLMLGSTVWAQFPNQLHQTSVYQLNFQTSPAADWQVPDGVSISVNPKGGLHGTGSLVLRFDHAIPGTVQIRGPVVALPQSDPYGMDRRVVVKMDVQAGGLADESIQVRVQADGQWSQAVSPHRTWDTIIHMMKASDWRQWAQEQQQGRLNSISKQATLILLVTNPAAQSVIELDQLEISERAVINHLIDSPQRGHVFDGDHGQLTIRPAYPDQLVSGRIELRDELNSLLQTICLQKDVQQLQIQLPSRGFYNVIVQATYQDGRQIRTDTTAAVIGDRLSESVRKASRYGLMRVHATEDWAVQAGANMEWGMWRIRSMTLGADGLPAVTEHPVARTLPLFQIQAMTDILPDWLRNPSARDHGLYPPRDWDLFEKTIETWAKNNPNLPDVVTVYNEPDAHWRGSRQELVRFCQTFARAVKRARPEAVLGGPGFYSIRMDDFKEFVQMGILQNMDCLVIHAYVNGSQPEDEFIQRIADLKAYLKQIGKADMPIYLTEFGWTCPPGDWQTPVDDITKARYCARSLILGSALDVDGLVYFCGRHASDGLPGYAIVHSDYTPTPAYSAYTTLVRQMSTIHDGGQWLKLSPSVNWVGFTRENKTFLVLWDTQGSSQLQLPTTPQQIIDMTGREVAVTGPQVTLSPSPIYVSLDSPDYVNIPAQSVREQELLPGDKLPLAGDDVILPNGLTYENGNILVPAKAALGTYTALVRRGKIWTCVPIRVNEPLTMQLVQTDWHGDATKAALSVAYQSHFDKPVDARFQVTVDGHQSGMETLTVQPGQLLQRNLQLPVMQEGKRYQGTVKLSIEQPIEWQVTQPLDTTLIACPVVQQTPTNRIWALIKPIQFTNWSPWPGTFTAADCSASYKMLCAPAGLYLKVAVQDDEHFENGLWSTLWAEDSLQVAFDVDVDEPWQPNNVGHGLNGHRITEYGLASHMQDGKQMAWRWRAYAPGLKCGPAFTVMNNLKVTRDNTTAQTSYTVMFPWQTLGLDKCPAPGQHIGFSLVVNDKDSRRDRHALRLFGGILGNKDPRNYGRILLVQGPVDQQAGWSLPPISGHAPGHWDDDPANWKWSLGNPLQRDGATWTLGFQDKINPELTDPFTLMTQGYAWGYNYVWRDQQDKKDPTFFYIQRKLSTKVGGGACAGPASMVNFAPHEQGTYRIQLAGKITVQNKTAGHARLEIAVLDTQGKTSTLLQTFDLNQAGGYGSFPSEFVLDKQAILGPDKVLIVRIQTINPGPGSASKSEVAFDQFEISAAQ